MPFVVQPFVSCPLCHPQSYPVLPATKVPVLLLLQRFVAGVHDLLQVGI